MYESYWQLSQKPFGSSADERYYFPAESHQAALLKLRYAVENHRGAALLTGPSGSGKTLLAGMLPRLLGDRFAPVVHLVFPQMSRSELLVYLADELDGSRSAWNQPSVQESVRRIEHFLGENAQRGGHAVVIVDEAHLIRDAATLETLRLLLNFQPAGQGGLTLILAGQPGLLPTLDRTPQLDERMGVKCLLRPFNQQETAEYVSHRLTVAGATRAIFEPEAMPALHALTHGIARRINRLCDLSLLIGFAEERHTLGAEHLESVAEELLAVVPE